MTGGDVILVEDAEVPVNEASPERITVNADGTKTLQLLYPKTVKFRKGGQETEKTFDALTFRRPTGGDMRAVANLQKEGDQLTLMFTRLANIPEALFDVLDAADIEAATEVMEDFLPKRLKAGKES